MESDLISLKVPWKEGLFIDVIGFAVDTVNCPINSIEPG